MAPWSKVSQHFSFFRKQTQKENVSLVSLTCFWNVVQIHNQSVFENVLVSESFFLNWQHILNIDILKTMLGMVLFPVSMVIYIKKI